MSFDLDIILPQQDGESSDTDDETKESIRWLLSRGWKKRDHRLDWDGNLMYITYRCELSGQETSEFFGRGLNQLKGLHFETTVEGLEILMNRTLKPEDVGDSSINAKVIPNNDIYIPAPDGFEYYPFQRAAIEEIVKRESFILADDPGLGKTVQACGVLNYFECEKVLILCPAGAKGVWANHLRDWIYYDIPIHVMSVRDAAEYYGAPGIIVTGYESIRDDDCEALRRARVGLHYS